MNPVIYFHDSTDPLVIPERWYAALYADGLYGAEGLAARRKFRHARMITIADDFEGCGILDYEDGNPCYFDPGLVTSYLVGRQRMGRRGRVYCDRSDLASAMVRASGLPHEWWIAAWSGPGPDFAPGYDWTAEELAADIKAREGLEIDPATIWAIQFRGGPGRLYDTNRLCRVW